MVNAAVDSAVLRPEFVAEVDAAIRSVLAVDGPRRPASRGPRSSPSRLFSLRHAEALPAATREVRVAPGTVVTPLARDFLKRRGIALRVVSSGEVGPVEAVARRVGVRDRVGESGLIAALRRALARRATWAEVGRVARRGGALGRRGARSRGARGDGRGVGGGLAGVPGRRASGRRRVAEPEAVARAVRRLGVELARGRAGREVDLLDEADRPDLPPARGARDARRPRRGGGRR